MTSDQIDYDALPYTSLPFPQTQPARLAAWALLKGFNVSDIGTARVLELGCAAGGNLMPLAARFPRAFFEGLDLAERHIRDGKKMIAALGLDNISLLQADIAAFDTAGRSYDFIICHGVYSWTPPAVQDSILRICRETLSENGLAYISYNVLPGWNVRMIVRDICQRYAPPHEQMPPKQRLDYARRALKAFDTGLDLKTPFGQAVHGEIEQCLAMTDPHFQGEFLGPFNTPCHFQDFIAHAASHDLAYICDAAPQSSTANGVTPSPIPVDIDRKDLAQEQNSDFVSGRMFRRSILRKTSANPAKIQPDQALSRLHFASALSLEPGEGKTKRFVKGRTRISTNDPVVVKALTALSTVYPATLSYDELVTHAVPPRTPDYEAVKTRLSKALRQTASAGHVTISTVALNSPDTNDPPALWAVARMQMDEGHAILSARNHEPISLHGAARHIANLVDGTRDESQLTADVLEAVKTGKVSLTTNSAVPSAKITQAHAAQAVHQLLRDFRRGGLLA